MKKGQYIMRITIGIMCFLLTMTIFIQFRVTKKTKESNIDTMQEAELRKELANWKAKYDETKEKNAELNNTLDTYKKEGSSDAKTRENLEKELEDLEQALGRTDVQGEGIIISLRPKTIEELAEEEAIGTIYAVDLLTIVNALKDAGAEAISINDERIVNTTDIVEIGGSDEDPRIKSTIKINSKHLRTNEYEIKAIGNSSYLESSIFGKGGYAEELNTVGIKATSQKSNKVLIKKYTGDFDTKYLEEVN